ncbi:MAG: hypothetical protein M3419_09825 [Actinomycetota bacterium]|nr:hypothetical protein [Actinomycetota bacterium]
MTHSVAMHAEGQRLGAWTWYAGMQERDDVLDGIHTSHFSASGGGYRLDLDYPRVARAGLDITWRVTVTHDGGFDAPITLAVTADYFDIYETQAFHPEPDSSTRDAGHAPPHVRAASGR